MLKGDWKDVMNPTHWTEVMINSCPGMGTYNQAIPRLYKWNPVVNAIACDYKTFMDNLRLMDTTRKIVHSATHREETMMTYLGLQDAVWKWRAISQQPDEWTGSITISLEVIGLFVTVSQSKWDRTRRILQSLLVVPQRNQRE